MGPPFPWLTTVVTTLCQTAFLSSQLSETELITLRGNRGSLPSCGGGGPWEPPFLQIVWGGILSCRLLPQAAFLHVWGTFQKAKLTNLSNPRIVFARFLSYQGGPPITPLPSSPDTQFPASSFLVPFCL